MSQRAAQENRRARKRNATTPDEERKVRKFLRRLREFKRVRCAWCGEWIDMRHDKWHLDHIVPLARGGRHEVANLQPLHAACNLQKGDSLDPPPSERGGC
ncbi:MAG: HNH endonuclease signature motif containing protein [Planctomycetota bacterium]